ncbi:MAG TPA: hypothetical protein VHQ64_06660, partial [Pyrinomonadaceae bacterium]|nr:hypothetical protein [Pyrinomonadaceae bacterium]
MPKINVPIRPRAAGAAHHEMIGEYHLTMLADRGLLPRLGDAFAEVGHNYQLTWPEFKRDPFGFTKRSIQGYGAMAGKFFSSRDVVVAMLLAVASMLVLVGAIFLLDR